MYIWKSIKTELTSEQILDYQESEYNKKRENVYAFLRLPWALEKVINLQRGFCSIQGCGN